MFIHRPLLFYRNFEKHKITIAIIENICYHYT